MNLSTNVITPVFLKQPLVDVQFDTAVVDVPLGIAQRQLNN